MKKLLPLLCVLLLLCGCTKELTVSIDSDNGSAVSTLKVEQGKTLVKPADPEKEGYVFNYWEAEGKEFDFTQAIEKDLTIKATYTKLYTVTFKAEGKVIDTRTVKEGDSVDKEISLPIPPEKEGYDFMGWQVNGQKYDTAAAVKSDLEITAAYREIIYAKSIAFVEKTIVVEMNQTVNVNYILTPNDSTEIPDFKSANENIARVDENGIITPVAIGETKITVSTANASAKVKVVVKAATVQAESVSLDKTILDINAGDTVKLAATVLPAETTDKKLTYTTSDKTVATVDTKGNVKGVGVGTATITVSTSNGCTASCEVNVNAVAITGIQLDKTTLTLAKKSSVTLNVNVAPANATDRTISFTSTHPEIATVDSTGKVTGVAKGTTTIVATSSNGKTSTCDVEVFIKADSVTIVSSGTTIAYDGNKETTFTVTVTPSDADYSAIGWNTSGSVGGQNGVYAFSSSGNTATLTAREISKYSDNTCGVYAYITNKDGSVTNSNAVTIASEKTLTLTKRTSAGTWELRSNGKYYGFFDSATNVEIVANCNISASFNNKTFVDQEHYEDKEVWMTLVNSRDHQEGFNMTVETPGGQTVTCVISVNAE